MLKQLEHITKSKSVAGLEIVILPDGGYQLQLIILKKQQSTLVSTTQRSALSTFADAKAAIDPKTPLMIVINGKGIIHRKVHTSEQEPPTALLNKLLPNANVDDFIIQKTPLHAAEAFVSVIRLTAFQAIIEELISSGLTNVVACFLGPFVITNLFPVVEPSFFNSPFVDISNFRLQLSDQQITGMESTSNTPTGMVKIGNERFTYEMLLPFAAALAYFTGDRNDVFNSQALNQLKEEFRQKQKFELRGWTLLITTFLILIINYFVFDHYWTQNKEMTAQLESTQAALNQYEKLKAEYGQKQQFLKENGLLENSRTSYYADQLAAQLPVSIQLTGLNIHPLKKKKAGEEDKGFVFENQRILVSGNCQQNTALNEWMKKVKKFPWVEEVALLNYTQDNLKENGVFLLEIKIK